MEGGIAGGGEELTTTQALSCLSVSGSISSPREGGGGGRQRRPVGADRAKRVAFCSLALSPHVNYAAGVEDTPVVVPVALDQLAETFWSRQDHQLTLQDSRQMAATASLEMIRCRADAGRNILVLAHF